jgi:hypothetical protein
MFRPLLCLALIASLAVGTHADTAPAPPPPDPWAIACGEAMTTARTRLAKTHKAFKTADVMVQGPIDLPARSVPKGLSLPPVFRAGSAVHFSLQLRNVPEYFYADVIDARDDKDRWSSHAGAGRWTCVESRSGTQRNNVCAMRVDDRIAIVRAIFWRAKAPRPAAYVAAVKHAAEACLRPTPP